MGYDARFEDAVDFYGNPVREKGTGNLIGHCVHQWIARVMTRTDAQDFGALRFHINNFDGLDLRCIRCGEFSSVAPENLLDAEAFEKRLDEELAEFKKKQPFEKRRKKR